MRDTLNDLFYGNVYNIINEQIKNDNEYLLINQKIEILKTIIKKQTNKKSKKILTELTDLFEKLIQINLEDGFKHGVKTGVKLSKALK